MPPKKLRQKMIKELMKVRAKSAVSHAAFDAVLKFLRKRSRDLGELHAAGLTLPLQLRTCIKQTEHLPPVYTIMVWKNVRTGQVFFDAPSEQSKQTKKGHRKLFQLSYIKVHSIYTVFTQYLQGVFSDD